MKEVTKLTQTFKLRECDVEITITGSNQRILAMADLMTFIEKSKPVRKKRRTKAEMAQAELDLEKQEPTEVEV